MELFCHKVYFYEFFCFSIEVIVGGDVVLDFIILRRVSDILPTRVWKYGRALTAGP